MTTNSYYFDTSDNSISLTPSATTIEISEQVYSDCVLAIKSSGTLSLFQGSVLVTMPLIPPTLAQAQAAQIGLLAAAYANAIVQSVSYTSKAGVVQTYQADARSVANLQSMMLAFSGAAATPTGFPWIALDNTAVPFAYADLQGLAAVLGAQGLAAFLNLQAKKVTVLAATTIVKVQAVAF